MRDASIERASLAASVADKTNESTVISIVKGLIAERQGHNESELVEQLSLATAERARLSAALQTKTNASYRTYIDCPQ